MQKHAMARGRIKISKSISQQLAFKKNPSSNWIWPNLQKIRPLTWSMANHRQPPSLLSLQAHLLFQDSATCLWMPWASHQGHTWAEIQGLGGHRYQWCCYVTWWLLDFYIIHSHTLSKVDVCWCPGALDKNATFRFWSTWVPPAQQLISATWRFSSAEGQVHMIPPSLVQQQAKLPFNGPQGSLIIERAFKYHVRSSYPDFVCRRHN